MLETRPLNLLASPWQNTMKRSSKEAKTWNCQANAATGSNSVLLAQEHRISYRNTKRCYCSVISHTAGTPCMRSSTSLSQTGRSSARLPIDMSSHCCWRLRFFRVHVGINPGRGKRLRSQSIGLWWRVVMGINAHFFHMSAIAQQPSDLQQEETNTGQGAGPMPQWTGPWWFGPQWQCHQCRSGSHHHPSPCTRIHSSHGTGQCHDPSRRGLLQWVPQAPQKPWTGLASTGSSMWSFWSSMDAAWYTKPPGFSMKIG